MLNKIHYYFILRNRPWALFSRFCALNFFLSFYIFMKFSFMLMVLLSLLNLIVVSFFWWRDYTREFTVGGRSRFVDSSIKFRMVLFIRSEVFFFFSFFWAYFHYFLGPNFELGLSWPPFLVRTFYGFGIPLLNTLLLVSSGVTITVCHYYIIGLRKKNIRNYNKRIIYLLITIFFGLFFTICQYLEYKNSWFCIRDSTFGRVVFVLTGFHGLHVLIGTIFLIVSSIRLMRFFCTNDHILGFELCAWYWHFVDVVWLFLYIIIYFLLD